MGSRADGALNGYAFPPEPEDGTVAAEQDPLWMDLLGVVLCVLAVVGCVIVGIRIVLGLLGKW